MNLDMLHPADQIVLLMNRIYDHGMTTASGTDLSVRDAEGTVWISPDGVDKGNLRREDVAQIKADGSIAGMHRPSAEYPLHLAIYRKRPDVRAVLHARPSTLIACDLMGMLPDCSMLPRIAENARRVSAVSYEIPGSSALGARISAAFANGADAVVPERHGVVIGAPTLPGAFRSLEALCLRSLIQRNAKIIGGAVRHVSDGDIRKIAENSVCTMPEFTPVLRSSEELSARRELCKLSRRAYDKQLITSGNGSFSCRLSDGSLLITPASKDRQSPKAEDFVLISDGKRESGKIPCPTVNRHLAIYANDPDIGSIMEAIPPFGMAFAVTARAPDLRFLPETYISLRDVRIYPTLTDDGTLARDMTLRSPAAMIENDCVLTVGASLLGAFNQLELLENGAKILTEALAFGGTPRGIDAEAFMELEQAFNL